MKNLLFWETESFEYFTKKSARQDTNRFDGDIFLPTPKMVSETPLTRRLFLPLFLTVVLVFFLLILRLSSLQIIEGARNLAFSESNRIRKERIRPQRGLITDYGGNVLARNLPTFSIIYNPQFCTKGSCSLSSLEKLGDLASIKERYEKNNRRNYPFVLISGLSRDEILSLGNLDDLAYLQIESDQVRSYPYGELFSHVTGFLGEVSEKELSSRNDLFLGDRIGKEGIEKIYDTDLRGTAGYRLIEVDSTERQKRFLNQTDPVSGRSVVLTLRRDLQEAALNALKEAEQRGESCCGAVVVQDARSGAILSLVSHPSFDPNIFSGKNVATEFKKLAEDGNQPFFNRAVSGNFPPGSVFKIAVAAAALSEGIISENTVLNAPGSLTLGSFSYGDWKPEGHGQVNIKRALAESADTFFYQIGGGFEGRRGLGPEKIADYARRFGFGQTVFIDLPQANPGLVPDPGWKIKVKGEDWYVGNTYHLSIGQGDLLVTPLQVNQMTVATANGGVLFRPFLLSKIVDATGRVTFESKPSIIREKFADPQALRIVREGMREAAEEGGTAYPFFDFKVKVGAKTGTAESGTDAKPHAWFTVFAPFENPQVAVTVLVESGGQGSDIAAPVAKKILEEYFRVH